MKLYLNERPRTFIITSGKFALIVRHPFPTIKGANKSYHSYLHHHHSHNGASKDGQQTAGQSAPTSSTPLNKVIVEFVSKETLKLTDFRDITPNKSKQKQIFGFLGFLNVKSNIYLGFITSHHKLALPMIGEDIYTITGVDFYCLNNDEYDHLIGRDQEPDISLSTDSLSSSSESYTTEYPAASIRRFLNSGSFFYSNNFDITSNLQERSYHKQLFNSTTHGFNLIADSPYFCRFMWNSFMNSELIAFRNRLSPIERRDFDLTGFLVTIARGFAQTVNTTVLLDISEDALLTIISKQSCLKNGPLFGDWGCDDNGAVSNFVETEVIVYTKTFCFSYVMVRGNVPIFWESENSFNKKSILSSKKSKKIIYPRSFEASQHAFTRHFERLNNQFSEVYIVNTLTDDINTYKGELNKSYKEHIDEFNKKNREIMNADMATVPETEAGVAVGGVVGCGLLEASNFPLPTSTIKKLGYTSSQPTDIVRKLLPHIINNGAFFYDITRSTNTGKQLGVFRANSFDCLSKSNFVQKVICQEVLELALRDIGVEEVDHDLLIKHGKLWAANDEQLTKMTNNFVSSSSKLHKSSAALTKGTIKSHLAKKYLSGVVTESKPNEMAMLKLLGRLQDQASVKLKNPIHDYVTKELKQHWKEFSSFKDILVFSSTFNVNGCVENDEEILSGWLYPETELEKKPVYDVVFIGFQEIVELSPGQMVNANSMNRLNWINYIKQTLEKYSPQEGTKYVSLWDGQLGGIALLLFVKELELTNITNVEGSFKKTGLGGVSANKGGVLVSFNYSNTQICLVASHLAAGLSNEVERHHDYRAIAKGLKFSKNRRIRDHDIVIWLGDFNYRIGTLNNEQVKTLVKQRDYSNLFEYDQLNKQMAAGELFPFFDEMEIKFPPTYKFDNGTKTYDTSEKQRIPAWTDRILSMSKGKKIKQLYYNSFQDIIFSDHRPVLAIFKVSVNIIDEAKKSALSLYLYDSFKKVYGGINNIFFNNGGFNVAYLLDGDDDGNLPPPSSDKTKWWIDGGLAARIYIPELEVSTSDLVINPKYPINPFTDTDDTIPEFVRKSKLVKENANTSTATSTVTST